MLNHYLRVTRRWLWLLLLAPVLAALAAYGLSQLTTPVYEASLTLWVSQASSAAGQQYSDILAAERLAKTYGALITKRPVLQATIDELKLDTTPDDLIEQIEVKLVRDTQLLEVTARHTDRVQAAAIVNKLAEVFKAQNLAAQKESFNGASAKLKVQIEELQTQLKEARARLETLRQDTTPSQPERLEIERLNSAIAQYQVSYSSALKSLEDLRLTEATNINNVTVAEEATVPDAPVSPRTSLNLLLGLVLGLLVGAGVIAALEYLDDSFKSPDDIEAALGVSTLGVVELIGGKKRRPRKNAGRPPGTQPLVALNNLTSHEAEAYRLLRTNLDFTALDRPVRKLVVTSALPQEGKSTTCGNLAVVMAQSGKRVLLVDLDLRHPTVHKTFKVPNLYGVTAVLLGAISFDEAVQEVGIENLRVLTSGPLPPSPADTLSSQAMGTLLDTLSHSYDIVIADSPPVMVASDAVVIASRMDGVLLVTAAQRTSRRVVRQACEALQRGACTILGAVLNMQPPDKRTSYSYYSYGTGAAEKPENSDRRGVEKRTVFSPSLGPARVQKRKEA